MTLYWRSGDNEPSFEINQNVFVQRINGKHIIVSQQNDSTPGIVFKHVKIRPNTNYTFTIFGHASTSESAFVVAYQGSDILYKSYTFLPIEEQSTTIFQFKTNTYMESVTVGVCFTSPKIGDSFTLERVSLEPTVHIPRVSQVVQENTEGLQPYVKRIVQWFPSTNTPPLKANQHVMIHKSDKAYIVTTHQSTSTPGVLIRNIPVQSNTEYKFAVTGYSNTPNAFLMAYDGKTRLSPNYVLLPESRGTVEAVFTTTSMRIIHIGICFTRPQIGNTFYVENITLDTMSIQNSSQTPESSLSTDVVTASSEVSSAASSTALQSVNASPQQIAHSKMVSWSYFQYSSLICQATHVELADDVCQCSVVSGNGTPALFMDIHIPIGKSIRFTMSAYTSYPDFRLCIYSPSQNKELISCAVPVGEVLSEQYIEFTNENNSHIWVGLTCTRPRKGYTAFVQSMDIREVSFVDECFMNGSIDSIEIPYKKSLALSIPSGRSEIMESPGMMESPGICDDEEVCTPDTHENRCIRPRQIPEEIKNIEVQIFSLIDSINSMNVNLTKTEKKLIEKIKNNTA